MVNDLMEMLAVVLLPFSIMAAAIVLVILVTVFLIVGFWRLMFGTSD